MINSQGAISFEAAINNAQFRRSIAQMNGDILGLTRSVDKEAKQIDNSLSNLGKLAAGAFAFSELSQLPKKLIDVRGEFQQLEIAFNTMLGSKAKADALFKDVVKFAATTPFDLKGVAGASKQLLAYGFASEDVIEKLRRLGDISAGLNIPLSELTELYGKTKTNGRLFAEDLNQYVGRGIPLIKLLADQFRIAEEDVRSYVEQGKVGFPEVEKAINKLTDSGGTFAGLMAEQAKSLTGLYSNFEDSVMQAFNNVGKSQETLLGDSIKFATTIVENYEPILDILTVIVATYGTYKAAVIATAAVQSAAASGGAVLAWLELATTIRSAKDAQIAFNLATKANPYALAASALIALITAVALFSEETNEATKSQERALAIKEKFNQTQAEEISKVQILNKQIQDEGKSREERNQKLKELIAISPQHFNALTLDNIATTQGADAIRDYTKALEKKLKVQASEEQIVANNKRIRDIQQGALDEEFKPGAVDRVKYFLQDSGFDEKTFKKETEKRKNLAVKALEDENSELLKVAVEGEKQRAQPTAKKAVAAKPKVDREAKEEKDVRIKTFEEEIEEKKQMYALYQRWIDSFGKDAADKQFAELLSRNKDYVSYLDSELQKIETAKNYQGFNMDDAQNVDFIIREKTEATGGKSAIEQYKDQLTKAKEEAASLTDYLVYLKTAQDGLSTSAPTSTVIDQRKAVAEAELITRKQLKDQLNQYLLGVAGSEQKRLEIQSHYAELRKALEERYTDNKGEEYQKALKQMSEDEQREFKEQTDRLHEQSKEFKALSKVISETGREGIKIKIGREEDELTNIRNKYGSDSEEYKRQVEIIKALNKDLADSALKNFDTWGQMVGVLADSLSEIPGALGSIGSALAAMTSGIGNFSKAMERSKEGKVGMDQYAAAAQGAATLINIVTSAATQRKQAEEEYYNSAISQQSQYNLLLNKQIGLQADATKSVFYTDYQKVLDSGIAKMNDAQEGFEKSLNDLANGRAKDGQKNGVDWKAVGAGATAGASIGAVAGAGVFSWAGAAIGAAGGAIAGLIGGLKKKDTFTPILEAWPDLIDKSKEGIDQFNIALAQTLIDNNQVDEATKRNLQSTIEWANQLKEAQAQIKGVISDLAGALGNDLRDGLVNAFREGTDAAEAWGDSVEKILESIISQMVFAKTIGPLLDELEVKMDKSMAEGGDKDWIDDFGWFFQNYGAANADFKKKLEEAQKEAEKYGLDLYESKSGSGGSKAPQQGTITGASQESINILSGQITATRIIAADHLQVSRSQLMELSGIRANTGATAQHTAELIQIRRDISEIVYSLKTDFLRANGG